MLCFAGLSRLIASCVCVCVCVFLSYTSFFFLQIFAIVVFATITGEGYVNPARTQVATCMFNSNDSACSYGVAIGVLAFLACVVFLALDAYLPQISNAKERKYIVTGDLAFSGSRKSTIADEAACMKIMETMMMAFFFFFFFFFF